MRLLGILLLIRSIDPAFYSIFVCGPLQFKCSFVECYNRTKVLNLIIFNSLDVFRL